MLVHGIRASATMWRAQVAHLQERGVAVEAIDLPGHGSRIGESWSADDAMASIDRAVQRAAHRGPVVLAAHSMGALLSIAYAGRVGGAPPVHAFVAAGATAFPVGTGLAAYRALLTGMRRLPGHGMWSVRRALAAQLPIETREDFGAGGYALAAEDEALRSLASLEIARSLVRLQNRMIPTWFLNGEWDQLRLNERAFTRLVPRAELIVVPRTTHLVTAMRPRLTNAVIDVAIAEAVRSACT